MEPSSLVLLIEQNKIIKRGLIQTVPIPKSHDVSKTIHVFLAHLWDVFHHIQSLPCDVIQPSGVLKICILVIFLLLSIFALILKLKKMYILFLLKYMNILIIMSIVAKTRHTRRLEVDIYLQNNMMPESCLWLNF